MAIDDEDPRVKQLLDPATEADLARWFGLPSFQQLAEAPPPPLAPVDPEMQAVVERREKAIAAVDPALVDRIRIRTEERPDSLVQFAATIDVRVDEHFGTLDERMINRASSIAEPREVEISEQLRDDLNECTPQALLRDLHRAELYFDKTFEVVDMAREQRLDAVAEVKSAMSTHWKLDLGPRPFQEGRALVEELRADRRRPWIDVLPTLRNRTVQE
jgi:hypothetical protein